MTSSSDPSRRHLLVGAGVGAAAVAIGALPALAGRADAQSDSNLTGPDLELTEFHRSIELAFVKIYGLAIDTGLFDDEQTTLALQFLNHHQEHSAAAGAVGGVGVVPANQRLVNAYSGRVRTRDDGRRAHRRPVRARVEGSVDLPGGVRHVPRSPRRRPRRLDPVDRSAACDGAGPSREPSDRVLDPAIRIHRRRVHAGRVPGAGMSDELRRQMRDAELAQRESMGPFRDAVMRFAAGDPAFNRRGLFVAGGGLMAVVLAACADHSAKPQVPEGGNATPTTVTIAPPPVDDVTLLRTASSIEVLAVQTLPVRARLRAHHDAGAERRRRALPASAPRARGLVRGGDDRGGRRALHRGEPVPPVPGRRHAVAERRRPKPTS